MKLAGYIEPDSFNYLDHIVPFCDIFKAPIFVVTEEDFQIARKYYPKSQLFYKSISDLTPDFLVKNFDGLIHANFWDKEKFDLMFHSSKQKYQKNFRSIFMPHGNSDKGHHFPIMEKFLSEDISLVYGNKMLDFIKNKAQNLEFKNYISIGNLRYNFFIKNFDFYNNFVKEEVFSQNFDPSKKTIIYAPTWQDDENSSSFFDLYEKLITQIPKKYNLIIKLHSRLYDDYMGRIIHLMEKHKNSKNIKILYDFPLIYPLLYHCDIYLGDFSSVGYDFLAFNKPMFFFDTLGLEKDDKKRFLYSYGHEIKLDEIDNIIDIIERNLKNDSLLKEKRKNLYLYTFDSSSPKKIKQKLFEICKD
ncbi:MAG: CDP-glycerol glycerophosphotransferase family protein [Parachlamydiales bacterium]|nr:CDP-glycerol glycerophosphotransferase family protein [Parachlamydiales bacterium]